MEAKYRTGDVNLHIFSELPRFARGSRAGIVCCSNGQPPSSQAELVTLESTLTSIGILPVFSKHIYAKDGVAGGTARERADDLMDFYRDDAIQLIFDISGGDIANGILPYLDYGLIARKEKTFWGYSDLTTVINAIYARTAPQTGSPSVKTVLYQVRNLIYDHAGMQCQSFSGTVLEGTPDLLSFEAEFVQGELLNGVVVGGNIRCLLKLAGTPYWPDMRHKILLLEAYGGRVPQMTAYLNQLAQMGVFAQIQGILLGTFTELEKRQVTHFTDAASVQEKVLPSMAELVKQYVGPETPIARTGEIGHGTDAKAIIIGGRYRMERSRKAES